MVLTGEAEKLHALQALRAVPYRLQVGDLIFIGRQPSIQIYTESGDFP